jgi:hypothetical protein
MLFAIGAVFKTPQTSCKMHVGQVQAYLAYSVNLGFLGNTFCLSHLIGYQCLAGKARPIGDTT